MIKKTGSFEGQPNKLGGGGRFKQMVASGRSPALSAFIGRKIYGKKKMSKIAAKAKADSEGASDKTDKNRSKENEAPKGVAVGKKLKF